MKTNIIAEIGINHNGSMDDAKKLIDIASVCGCTHVKFQKRNPEKAVPEDQKNKEKIVPWRDEPTIYLQYKKDIEFSIAQYEELFRYTYERHIIPFASVWDLDSAYDMRKLMSIVKIPSAKLTDDSLLCLCRDIYDKCILSTGMSTEEEIEHAIEILDPQVIMHTNSAYPCTADQLNLGYLKWLLEMYPDREIGFSNHFYGIVPMIVTVGLGSKWIEFHITLDHGMWGSDQSSSVEMIGVSKLVKAVREIEAALEKGYGPREVYPEEQSKIKTLRG